jgi:hypothetical protein
LYRPAILTGIVLECRRETRRVAGLDALEVCAVAVVMGDELEREGLGGCGGAMLNGERERALLSSAA